MTVQIVERRVPLPRWTYELDGRRSHRGHHVRSVCHRRDDRGRARLAARCCFTCRAILREWTPCGACLLYTSPSPRDS